MSSIKFHIDLSLCPVALYYLHIFFFYLQLVLNALMHLVYSDPRAGLFKNNKVSYIPTHLLFSTKVQDVYASRHMLHNKEWLKYASALHSCLNQTYQLSYPSTGATTGHLC